MFDSIMITRAYQTSVPDRVRRTFIDKGNARYVKPASQDGSLLPLNRTVPSLVWSEKPSGISYLTASVSLPKFLYGTNTMMLSDLDIPRALDAISDFTSQAAGVEFDAATANMTRLDVCHTFQVGEADAYAYLGSLRDAKIPYLSRRCFDGTVDFVNRKAAPVVSVYAKHAETIKLAKEGKATEKDIERSRGILRLERRYKTTDAVKALVKQLKLSDRCAATLLQYGVYSTVMNDTIKELGLGRVIDHGDNRLDVLLATYGATPTYMRLAGFLTLCEKHGADNLVNIGFNAETVRRNRKELIAAGVSLSSKQARLLPPLRLVPSHALSVAA